MQDASKRLPKLAVRIFSCPANSVTSEQAFSTQNFLHNKVRNRLQSTQVDKLIFIYMTDRVLRAMKKVDGVGGLNFVLEQPDSKLCHGPSREATFNASWPIREPGGIPGTLHRCAGLLYMESIGG
jgi:hAT family C-terminal dimerisation region